ncbi:MAG: hypothetical protein U0176_04860 [Bacteroidia bacterium]
MQWATQVTANAESEGKVLFVDAHGNVYAAGLFRDTVDIDPGPGVVLVETPGTATYVHKLDSNGHFIWGGSISTTDINVPRDIRVIPNGNVYLTGAVRGVADFDIGPAFHNLGTPYIWGGYTVCLDNAGNFLWAQVIENINLNTNDGAKVDSVGNVWIVGTIRDTVDFDPGPGVQVHIGTNSNEELVCAKYDPAGNFLFANLIGGPEYEASTSLNICPSGVYVLGYFEGTVDFDPGPGTVPLTALIYSPADRHSPFVLKYTHAGALDWVVRLDSLVPFGLSMAQEDNQGNLVMAFTFQARLDMNPGPGIDMTYSTMYNQAIAVIKLDPNGNYLWGMGLDGTGNEEFKTLGIDGDGGIYVIGNFETILDFDPGPGIAYLQTPTPGYYGGPGLLKLDPAGNFAWVTLLREGGYVKPEHIVFDDGGDCYITGSFAGNSDLAPALLDTAILHGGNFTDPYILKLRFDACNNYLLSIDSVADIHCATQMGWMSCSGNGTSASFAYSWNTNPPTLDSVALPTSPGIYTVTANDSSGCRLRSVLVNGPSAGNGFDMQAMWWRVHSGQAGIPSFDWTHSTEAAPTNRGWQS